MPTHDEIAEKTRLARSRFAQTGSVTMITVRPAAGEDARPMSEVEAVVDEGLVGDHYSKTGGKRQVTLIQAEHLDAVAQLLGRDSIDPALTRRNITVSGINLAALIHKRVRIGSALLQVEGPCPPCWQMEELLGAGGLNAMEGHGGIIARVLEAGTIKTGDRVEAAD